MKTYSAIKAEIAKLEKEAEAARKNELKAVIAQLKKAIEEHALTANDLGLDRVKAKAAERRAPRASAKAGTASRVGPPRYRNPKTQSTWTGRGRPPTWITDAKDRSVFLIDQPATPAAGAKKDVTSGLNSQSAKADVPSKALKPAAAGKKTAAKKPATKAAAKKAAVKGSAKKAAVKVETVKAAG